MADEVKISELPAVVTPLITDYFPVVQAATTKRETVTQLITAAFSSTGVSIEVMKVPAADATAFEITDGTNDYLLVNSTALRPVVQLSVESILLGPSQTPYFSWVGGAAYNGSGSLTASQSGTTVTGTGTNFPATCAGGYIYWPGTQDVALIVSRDSGTQLTVGHSQTVASSKFIVFYGGSYFGFAGINLNGSSLQTVLIDTPVAAAGNGTTLAIGTTNCTAIEIDQDTTLNESMTVDGACVFNAAQSVETRTVTDASDSTLTTDYTILFNRAGAIAYSIPAATASGRDLRCADISGAAAANNITITPVSGTINGAATYVINTNRGSLILHDGTSGDWSIF